MAIAIPTSYKLLRGWARYRDVYTKQQLLIGRNWNCFNSCTDVEYTEVFAT